jgi:hypothetical protein
MTDILAILLAALAGFGTGAVWFGTFGDRWLAAVGRTRAELDADRSKLPFAVGGVAALATSAMLWHVLGSSGIASFGGALLSGFGVGAFFAAPWILMNYAFAKRPRDLWWIDGGYAVVACTVIGAVQGLFV